MTLQIITNNQPRLILYGFELTDKEREAFDYYTPEELDSAAFFRYKGSLYDLNEFMPAQAGAFAGWQGYASDTYFSGVVVKYTDDNESVIVGRYYA